jgi:hypothetical protein
MARVKFLHIATSLRIVAKHRHMPGIPVGQAREIIGGEDAHARRRAPDRGS